MRTETPESWHGETLLNGKAVNYSQIYMGRQWNYRQEMSLAPAPHSIDWRICHKQMGIKGII